MSEVSIKENDLDVGPVLREHADYEAEYTTLNLGPTHPATHGVFQNILTMDGEKVVDAEQTIGYIHRAFEKIAERRPYYQITPLTDRMNYSHLLSIIWDGT